MQNRKSWLVLFLLLLLLVGADQLGAWTIPTDTPPDGNVDAPINTGTDLQIKSGALGVTEILTATGTVSKAIVIGEPPVPNNGLKLDVNGRMGADYYCNEDGNECFTTRNMFGGMFAETASGTSTCASSNYMTGSCTCPSGFTPKTLITGLTGSANSIRYCSPTS